MSTSTSMRSARISAARSVVAQADRGTPVVRQSAEPRGGGILDRRLRRSRTVRLACGRGRPAAVRRTTRRRAGGNRGRRSRRAAAAPAPGQARTDRSGARPRACRASQALVFGEDRLRRQVVAVVQREQQVAVARGVVGPQRQGAAIARFGLRVARLHLQRHRQVGDPAVLFRRQTDRVAGGRLGRDGGSRRADRRAPRLPCAEACMRSMAIAACNACCAAS